MTPLLNETMHRSPRSDLHLVEGASWRRTNVLTPLQTKISRRRQKLPPENLSGIWRHTQEDPPYPPQPITIPPRQAESTGDQTARSATAPAPPGKTEACGKSSSPEAGGSLAVGEAEEEGGDLGGEGVPEGQALKGAAPDDENSSVASLLRARLGR